MKFVAENVPADILPKPAGFRLLLAPVVIEDVSKGGIVIPAYYCTPVGVCLCFCSERGGILGIA